MARFLMNYIDTLYFILYTFRKSIAKITSVTGTSVTGTSVTGTSVTGTSVTGTSVTDTSVTDTSVTGIFYLYIIFFILNLVESVINDLFIFVMSDV